MRLATVAMVLLLLTSSDSSRAQLSPGGDLELVDSVGRVVGTLIERRDYSLAVSVLAPDGSAGILVFNQQGLESALTVWFEGSVCAGQAYVQEIEYAGVAGFSTNGIGLWVPVGAPQPTVAVGSSLGKSGECVEYMGPRGGGGSGWTPVVLAADDIGSEFTPPFVLRSRQGELPAALAVPAVSRLGLLSMIALLAVVGVAFGLRTAPGQ